MALRLIVELGPAGDDVDQVLDVDLDDALAVVEVTGEPLTYVWQVAGGAEMRLRLQLRDTP